MGVRSRRAAFLALMLAVVVSLVACDLTDSDGDGIADILETQHGWDPADPDQDGDGELDGQQDSDVDGLTDWVEEGLGTNPHDRTDPDPGYDSDQDSLTDWAENLAGTSTGSPDSDGDGWWDHEELLAATGPNDPLSHPRGIGDPPCDPGVESCPDVELFVMWITYADRTSRCPVPFCQPERQVTTSKIERQHWYVEAELGPFHANPDGSGFWPIESATVAGKGSQADSVNSSDPCSSERTDTTWSQSRPAPPPGPDVPFLTLSTSGFFQVGSGTAWSTEVVRRDKTQVDCGSSTSTSAWQPWTTATGPCNVSGFLSPDGVDFVNCTDEQFYPDLPTGVSGGRYRVRGTLRPPGAA